MQVNVAVYGVDEVTIDTEMCSYDIHIDYEPENVIDGMYDVLFSRVDQGLQITFVSPEGIVLTGDKRSEETKYQKRTYDLVVEETLVKDAVTNVIYLLYGEQLIGVDYEDIFGDWNEKRHFSICRLEQTEFVKETISHIGEECEEYGFENGVKILFKGNISMGEIFEAINKINEQYADISIAFSAILDSKANGQIEMNIWI